MIEVASLGHAMGHTGQREADRFCDYYLTCISASKARTGLRGLDFQVTCPTSRFSPHLPVAALRDVSYLFPTESQWTSGPLTIHSSVPKGVPRCIGAVYDGGTGPTYWECRLEIWNDGLVQKKRCLTEPGGSECGHVQGDGTGQEGQGLG